MRTNHDVIVACGGEKAVAYHLNVNQQTVWRWKRGSHLILEKYWLPLVKLSGGKVTYQQLAKINAK